MLVVQECSEMARQPYLQTAPGTVAPAVVDDPYESLVGLVGCFLQSRAGTQHDSLSLGSG